MVLEEPVAKLCLLPLLDIPVDYPNILQMLV